jgi:hypothetical protein
VLRFLGTAAGHINMVRSRTYQRRDTVMKKQPPIAEEFPAAAGWAIEDPSVASARVRPPREEPAAGVDPYQSREQIKPRSRRKDLRKLSEWIEAKRKADELKRQEAAAAVANRKGS